MAATGERSSSPTSRPERNHVARIGNTAVALVRNAGKTFSADGAKSTDQGLALTFGSSGVRAVLNVAAHPRHFVFEVESVEGEQVDELVLQIPLSLKGELDEPFAGCALALDLQTNVVALPGATSHLQATCYASFGLAGAKVAIIGCPQGKLRQALQEAVTAAPDLPNAPLCGPWALGKPINQGSYLFNFDGVTEESVDGWIELAQSLGMNQIDFHGGRSFRFGDCRPNPKRYPQGYGSLKVVIDKLHAAGIKAGLHTYAFFIDKSCPWVTPVPDPRLAKDATFTLSESLPPDGAVVGVDETTEKRSSVVGFAVRNGVTLQIDDELIEYSGVSKTSPYAFTGCRRGAQGTKASAHAKGAKVHHLKQCFGRFVPDPHTSLFTEVAAKTAEAFNECGFDMIYLDALDGSDILGGPENAWHYGAKFTYELYERLKKPALMEMSTFHHHLWCVRSRYCAWDHPVRSHKKFIDLHGAATEANRRMFMPGELGWWALKSWHGAQTEPTHADDIEHLMGRCIAHDCGFALMGIEPGNAQTTPALPRLAKIIKRYEDLRHSGKVPASTKAKLRVPGDEYTLVGDVQSGWHFKPVRYDKHRVVGREDHASRWTTENRFDAQPLRLRIEALMAAGPYDSPEHVTLVDFADAKDLGVVASAPGVAADLQPSSEQLKSGKTSGRFTASNSNNSSAATWCKAEKVFSPTTNLDKLQALGVWVHGDGQGELLNVQLKSPSHLMPGEGEHYIDLDFNGWRYFELIEPEGERHDDYQWPSGSGYSVYRQMIHYGQIERLALWYNHLPPKGKVTCYLGPIRALPLVASKLINPTVTVGDQTITFGVEIPSGHYLEFDGKTTATLYGPQGQVIREVTPQGKTPRLATGSNEARFQCDTPPGVRPRANVTVISHGRPLG